jgi:acyl transferase domain-containing protein/thioesterase domain-containing protein/acyl carrier protein
MKRGIEEVIRLIRGGELSASEEIAALSALSRNLSKPEPADAAGVLYATPFWSAEPVFRPRSFVPPQLAVVADLGGCGAELRALADDLVCSGGREAPISFRENDSFFADLASSSEPDEKIFSHEAFKAISSRSFEGALLILGDQFSPDCGEEQDITRERVFLGKLLCVFGIVKALVRRNPSADLRCVTLSDHSRMLSVGAAVSGLLKSLVLEHTRFSARTVWAENLTLADLAASAFLRDEIQAMDRGSYMEVRFRDGSRYVRRFQETAITPATEHPTVQAGDVVLLTGGLGGLGRIFAEYLVEERGACVALAGRTPQSMLDGERTAFLRSHASTVAYVQADLAFPDEVRLLVESAVRRFGRIDGVIHAAGVTSDGWLSGKSLSSVRDVLRPKVLGSLYLSQAVESGLKFFVNFSSLASYCGNVGQSDYACANAFLDHHAAVRSEVAGERSPCSVNVAINWPLWQSGKMRPSNIVTEQMGRAFGLGALGDRQGVLCFEAILASGYERVIVAAGDPDRLRTSFLGPFEAGAQKYAKAPSSEIRTGVVPGDENADVLAAITRSLQALAAEVLGLEIAEIDPVEPLAEYGFDSISLTGFAARINKLFSFVQLDSAVFLEHSSLNELTRYLFRRHSSGFTALFSNAASSPDQVRSTLLTELTVLVAETTAVPPADIAPDTSLSEYGFDSISLTELAARISRAWKWIQLDTTVFLLQPTLRGLCEHLLTKYESEFNAALFPTASDEGKLFEPNRQESSSVPPDISAAEVSGEIAIIGLGGRFPGARDVAELWKKLSDDISCISEIPADRWNWRDYSGDQPDENQKTDCHYGAFIHDIACFDPLHFDISPREAEVMDPQQRLLLQGAWETLETAGYSRSALAQRKVGVFVGVEKHDYLSVIGHSDVPLDGYVNTGNSHSMLVNRVSYFFDWTGPSVAMDTACSSSFSAISAAIRSLRSGESEMALAGGINVLLTPGVFVINRKMRMLTSDNYVRPFDMDASGHLYGEGLGLILLKPLSAAIRDDDYIHGVIRGMSVRHGGRGVFLTAPHAKAHVEVIEEALTDARVTPDQIDYIEAQGSSDRLADRIELKAYHTVFGSRDSAPVKIATIKGHTGHMGAASGVIAVIKAVLSLRNHRIIGTKNLHRLNWDASDGKFGCTVLDSTTNWEPKFRHGALAPRTVGIHNFGYGGVNGHLILQEFLNSAPVSDDAPDTVPEIVLLSARTREQVEQTARRLVHYLSREEHRTYGLPALRMRDIAMTLAVGREPLDVRIALLVRDKEQLIDRLERLGRGEEQIDGCYRGIVRAKRMSRDSGEPGDNLTAAATTPLDPEGLADLAKGWVSGSSIDWLQFFSPSRCRRVPLPTYPFSSVFYWVPQRVPRPAEPVELRASTPGDTTCILHPLLHAHTSSETQLSFRSVFTGEEPFLRDHVIQGQRVLPGVACLEMARAAVERWACHESQRGLKVELRNVVWMRPIAGQFPRAVEIRLYPSGELHTRFEITTPLDSPAQNATTHCQGAAMLLPRGGSEFVNLAKVRLETSSQEVSADRIYEAYRGGGVAYGPFFRCLDSIRIGDGQVLARLLDSSPDETEENAAAQSYSLPPGLMDSALQAMIGLLANGDRSGTSTAGSAFLPFGLERLTVQGPARKSVWAWLRAAEANRGKEGLQKVDIDLCSDAGEVLVSWRGFSNRPAESPVADTRITQHVKAEHTDPPADAISGRLPSSFLSHFSGDEYHLADHQGVLLGTVYLELARAAGERTGQNVVGLRNVVWTRPVLVEQAVAGKGGKDVWTVLQPERDHLGFQISTRVGGDGQSELIHAQGRLVTASCAMMARPATLNVTAIRARCSRSADTSECARALRRTHGPAVLSILSLHYGDREAIAELQLPPGAPARDTSRLHPSMLNGALLATVLPGLIRGSDEPLPAPFALEELWMFDEIPERAFACVRSAGNAYDIDITGVTGQVVIALRGFRMLSPAASRASRRGEALQQISPAPAKEFLAGAVLRRLAAIVSQRQKLSIEEIYVDRELTRYGFDSVGFTELSNQINAEMGLDLMPTVFFEYPDLKSLADHLAESHPATLFRHPGMRPGSHNGHQKAAADEAAFDERTTLAPRSAQERRQDPEPRKREPIAVIGMDGRFPGSPCLDEFWKNLEANRDLITEVPKDRWDWRSIYGSPAMESGRTKIKHGGFIDGVDLFDPLFFAISPLEAEAMDPQLRILLEATWAAIEDAGYRASSLAGTRTGFFAGVSTADYKELWHRANDPVRGAHGLSFAIANRVSYSFDLRGPSEVIDTACSSSLIAVHRAIESIRHGSCEMALAAGVNVMATPTLTIGGSQAGMLSEDGRCKTFDSRADGYGRGEGVGVVFLKPLSAAIEAGDRIYGLILGSAENHGGKAASPTAPNPAAQRDLLVSAYMEAGIDPRTVTYIEAHGTGTELGDPIEVEGLKAAFRELCARRGLTPPAEPYCALGSVKTNIGHLEAAAGISGLIKILLMIRHRKIPGNVHLKQENAHLRMTESPFYLARQTADWKAQLDEEGEPMPRRAGISSFGIGGSNAHVIVEEHIPAHDERLSREPDEPQLIVLSAKTSASLNALCRNLQQFAVAQPSTCLADLAYTLRCGREAMEERLAFVAGSVEDLAATLDAALAGNTDAGRIFRASVSRHRETLGTWASDEDMSATIDAWIAKGKLERVLDVWVKGFYVNWEKLPRERRPRRIGLPTYAFARERYWVPDSAYKAVNRLVSETGFLHPLVHRNTSELSGQRFSSRFTGEEFFLAEHVVQRRHVLPAVAYLEMARTAVELSVGSAFPENARVRLKNIVWVRPLAVSTGETLDVHIALAPGSDQGIRFEVYSEVSNGAGDVLVHCQGLAIVDQTGKAETLDPATLRTGLAANRIGTEECYDAFSAAGIEYGPAFRGIEEVLYGAGQVLATLRIPSVDGFGLHPALLDCALQSSIALYWDHPSANSPGHSVSLPFALDECEILAPCTPRMFAWIRPSALAGNERRVQKADLDLCDEEGHVCVRLKGLSARVSDASQRLPYAEGLLLYEPFWKTTEITAGSPAPEFARHLVLLCDGVAAVEHDSHDQLRDVDFIRLEPADTSIAENFENLAIEAFSTLKGLTASPSTEAILVQVIVPCCGEQHLSSGLLGLLRTIQLEQPRIRTQLIEVGSGEAPARVRDAILNSVHCGHSHCRYEMGHSEIASWREAPSWEGEAPLPWKAGGVYLITGGAGGLGLIFANEIARSTSGAVLMLVGRSELSPAQSARIQEVRSTGARVSYHRLDVSDLPAVQAFVAEIKTAHGHLDGVIHAAGLLRDEFILRKSPGSFREVLAPKVAGTLHLDQATRGMALDFFVLFSSGSGAFGNVGQADYATANAFMDAFAVYRSGLVANHERRGRTISINWPLWEHGAMQPDEVTRERLRASGIVPLRTSTGIEAFYRSLVCGGARVLVLQGEVARIRALFDGGKTTAAEMPPLDSQPTPPAARLNSETFEAQVAAYLGQVVSSTLKIPSERIELDAPMERYGIDSILVIHLTNRLEETFGTLSKTLFFEYQTLTELSRYFVETHAAKLRDLLSIERRPPTTEVSPVRQTDELLANRNFTRRFSHPVPIEPRREASSLDIAIIGMAGRYPESKDLDEYWENLRSGRNCITEVPLSRWDWRDYYTEDRSAWGHYSKWGGFIADIDKFDPLFFGISPREAEFLDPQERLFLEHAWMALEDAGYRRADLQKTRDNDLPGQVGVYAGVMFGEYQLLGLQAALSGLPVATASSFASIANRVSYVLNLHGPSMTVDTMCSSSLTSVHLACQDLKQGRTDLALAGGVNLTIHPNKYFLLSGGQFISSEGRCASFGVGGNGYVPGEGVGVVVLKRLADAERDGDHIYGVIKGSSVNHGGKTNGYSVPNPNAQQMAVAGALREAGIDARKISYVEAHGTGTVLGDPIEITGLTKAFRNYTSDNRYCWIGSAKSNIGHCESAAGIAGIMKLLLQMKHRELAPSIHSATLNPHIDFEATPFVVNQQRRDWQRPVIDGAVVPRIGAVSSFGAGGSNAHLIIEEYAPSAPSPSRRAHPEPHPIVLSARNEDRLNEYVARLLHFVRAQLQPPASPSSTGSAALRTTIISTARSHLSRLMGIDASQFRDEQSLEEYGVEPFEQEQLFTALQREFVSEFLAHQFTGQHSIAGIADCLAASAAGTRSSQVEFTGLAQATEATPDLAEIAWTLQAGREAMDERIGFLVESLEDLEDALSLFVSGAVSDSRQGTRRYRGQVKRDKGSVAIFERDEEMAALVRSWIEKRKYDRLLDLWVKGFDIDWSSLYDGAKPRRTSLPTYPFARERYWIQTAPAGKPPQKQSVTPPAPSLPERAIVACGPSWRDCTVDPSLPESRFSKHVVVLAGTAPCVAEEVEANLSGVRCVQLRFDPGNADRSYLNNALEIFELIRNATVQGPAEHTLIQVIIPPGLEARLLFGLTGLLNSARLENPRLVGQVIELPDGETRTGAFGKLLENRRSPQDSAIRYVAGRRQVARPEEVAFTERSSPLPWRDHGVYLITGGAGGLGLIFAEEIAAQTAHTTIVLTGRSPESVAIRKRLQGKAQTGSVIEYRQLDVREAAAVERVIAEIQSAHGGLHGVIHAAGVVRDSSIASKTPLEFQEVLGPKVAGTVNLDRATQTLDLDFLVLFSSLSGAFGNAGQSDYATANAFEDAYADYRQQLVEAGQRRGRTLSINWPLWQAGGMHVDDDLVAMMTRKTGMIPMRSESGLRAFYWGLSSGRNRLMFMEGDAARIRDAFRLDRALTTPVAAVAPDAAGLRANVLWALKRLLAEAVKLAPEAIDSETPIEAYGVESVAIGQMTQRLEKVFGDLPKTLFYEFQTLESLATHLVAEYPAACHSWNIPVATLNINPGAVAEQPAPASVLSAGSSAPAHIDRRTAHAEPIAIIGMAGRFPAANSLEDYWHNLLTGKACFSDVPATRWSLAEFYEPNPGKAAAMARSYCKTGSFLSRFADFDPLFFKIAPIDAYRLDPHERLLLTTCWEAMENSGHSRKSLQELCDGSVGVFVGVTKLGFHLHTQLGSTLETSRLPSTSFSSMANRISYQLNLSGPSMAIDTMCSSSVTAIHEACEHIRRGDCRLAFAASANLYLHPRTYIDLCLANLITAGPEPICFSAAGSGFVPGEAAGAILLKPLADAIRDADPIHGVIRASAINHGGKTTGYTAPNLSKQAEVVKLALERAGCTPDAIDFVESAANGSALGDAIELQALKHAFSTRVGAPCPIGTLKATVGHSEAASGISQLVKVLFQMKHERLAPTRNGGQAPDSSVWSKGPFELVTEPRLWPRRTSPRRALITSFGAGGSYGAMVVEDHPTSNEISTAKAAPLTPVAEEHAFVLSARTEQQLQASASNLLAHLRSTELALSSVAFTLQQGRDVFEHRLAIVASDQRTLIDQLTAFVEGHRQPPTLSGRKTNPDSDGVKDSVQEALERRDLKLLAQLWLDGYHDIPWGRLYDKPVLKCVLPGYPFAERAFWYDQQPSAASRECAHEHTPLTRNGQPSVLDIEKDLSSLIRNILLMSEEDPLDVHANFSELGLDSLNGSYFVRKVAEARGVELRETIIFDHPSVSALAGYISRLSAEPLAPRVVATSLGESSVGDVFKRRLGSVMREHPEVVPLQVEGEGPVIFCLHPMSGDVGLYAKLADASKLRFRMVGIKSRGLLSGEQPLESINAMAAHAVMLATAVLPEGTIHLLGSSMGGAVAYECARHLQLAGRAVGALVLLEPPLVENDLDAPLWASGSLDNLIMNANFLMIGALHMDPEFRRRKEAGQVKWPDLEITRKDIQVSEEQNPVPHLAALIQRRGAPLSAESLAERLESMAAVHLTNLHALSSYRAAPLPYPGAIHAVLLRTQSGAAISPDVYNPDYLVSVQREKGSLLPFFEGWRRVLPEMRVEIIEGDNHFDLLNSRPSVQHVSGVIDTAVNLKVTQPSPTPATSRANKIAVIGMSGRFPGAPTIEAFWELLKNGGSAFTDLPSDRGWSSTEQVCVKRGGFLPEIDQFDPSFFAIPPNEAATLDPAERLFLEETWKAIEDAGVAPASLAGKRWGVFCGGGGDFTLHLRDLAGISPHVTASGIPGRVSYTLSLNGPCVAVDAGCASSALAIAQAADALVLGQCEAAIAGGIWIFSTPNLLRAGCQSRLFSAQDVACALSANASGMMPGEAAGVVILKHLDKAVADGDRIFGVIEAWGSGHNGHTNGIAAPGVTGQVALYSSVYSRFGIDPATIGLVEANAVGTPLGDTIELEALTQTFRASGDGNGYCALGSAENNVGHSFQASGIVHVMKVLLALHHKQIPPAIGEAARSPVAGLDRTPFFINNQSLPWSVGKNNVRRAATSSFGSTGINVHLVFCEAPPASWCTLSEPASAPQFHLIALSGRTRDAVTARFRDLLDYVTREPAVGVGQISANLLLRRSHFNERTAFVVADREDLVAKLTGHIRDEHTPDLFAGSANRESSGTSSSAVAAALTRAAADQRRTDRGTLLAIAELYVGGVLLDLAQCYSAAEKTPLSLPSYPFERRRYWPADVHKTSRDDIDRKVMRQPEPPAANAATEIQSIIAEVSGYALSELPLDLPLSRLGLDSLMTMRILALVNERFSLELHIADLAENVSIQRLSSLAASEGNGHPAVANPQEFQSQVVKPDARGVLSSALWFFQRLAPVPRGLYVKSVETFAVSGTLLTPAHAMAQLLCAGIAVCHDGRLCHLVAHQSVDSLAVYDSLPPAEKQELIASLPAGVLVAPVSQEQERNLYHSEVMRRSSWNLLQTFEPGLTLDKNLLESALRRLMDHHDLLRTHYLRLNETWAQVILPDAPVLIEDIGSTTIQALSRLLEIERAKILDVYRLPIFRIWIAEADRTQYLALITHHSLADAFTPGMLFSELMTFYRALAEARPVPECAVTEQYWQFALRQFDPSVYRAPRTLEYWRDRLSGRSTSMCLPYTQSADRVDPEVLELADATAVLLPDSLVRQVERCGREHGLSHTQMFTTAIAALLVHGLENDCALLRFVNNQRNSASLMNAPGEFTNISFLILDVDPGATLLDTMREVKNRSLESLKFSRVDFRELLRLSDLSDYDGYYRQIGDVTIDSVDFDTGGAHRADSQGRLHYGKAHSRSEASTELLATGTLLFQVIRLAGEIRLLAFFRKHLFDKALIQSFCDLTVHLVEGMANNPAQRVSDLLSQHGALISRLRSRARDAHGGAGPLHNADAQLPAFREPPRPPYFTECQRVNSIKHGQPVFWVHGAFGDASVYLPLARGIDRPFYGIQLRGLFDDQAPLSGVPEIASFYVGMIKAIQPDGPYDLGGYSIGGVLAYEIARLLIAEGREVRSLCLVDTLFHPYYESLLRCSGSLAETYEFASLGLVEMSGCRPGPVRYVRQSLGKTGADRERALLGAFTKACLAAGVAKPATWIESFLSRMVKLLRGYRINEYIPAALAGGIQNVLYFRRRGGWAFGTVSGIAGHSRAAKTPVDYWSEWATLLPNIKFLEIVARDHLTILREEDALRVIGAACREIYGEQCANAAEPASLRAAEPEITQCSGECSTARSTVTEVVSQILCADISALDPALPLSLYGMDSFAMAQLIQRLRTAFDTDLDMSTMTSLDTLGRIVQYIEEQNGFHRDAELSTQTANGHWRVVRGRHFPELIRLNGTTDGRPVFWIHGGLGGVELYTPLAEVSERPFFGIQARGWMTDRAPLVGIQAMAAYYVHVMQSVQPEGPYDIGGYSLGGLIAFEVVRQLQEMGESVLTLVMVDTFDTSAFRDASTSDAADSLAWPILNFALQSQAAASGEDASKLLISREELDTGLTGEAKLTQLISLAKARGLRAPEDRLKDMVRRLTEVHGAYEADRYRIRPLPSPAAVDCRYFRNRRGLFLGALEPYYVPGGSVSWDHAYYWTEWKEHLPNFQMIDVDASNHMVMLTEPESRNTIVNACRELYSLQCAGRVTGPQPAALGLTAISGF